MIENGDTNPRQSGGREPRIARRRFLGALAFGAGSLGLSGKVPALVGSDAQAAAPEQGSRPLRLSLAPPRQGTPTPGGSLTVGLGEQPSTHNPYGGMSNRTTISQFLESLVGLDITTLEPIPLLATAWDVPDEKTYVFTLRKGVLFHDGTPFNADAVKAAFDYMLDPEVASPRASDFDRVDSVEVNDEHTVTFHLKEPFGVFLSTLARQGYFVSPTALKTWSAADLETKPPGTGPFKVADWIKDDKIVLERFEDYWDSERPYLDSITYRILPDGNVKTIAFKAGELDFVDNLPATEVAAIQANPTYTFASAPSTGYRSIYLNTTARPSTMPTRARPWRTSSTARS